MRAGLLGAADELSDVLLYLVRLAQQSRIDLSTAVLNKLAKNAAKYPADRVRGKSKKYNEYS
jgi:NTP pyrophosphatase (non-canonical NTP hydrolase)